MNKNISCKNSVASAAKPPTLLSSLQLLLRQHCTERKRTRLRSITANICKRKQATDGKPSFHAQEVAIGLPRPPRNIAKRRRPWEWQQDTSLQAEEGTWRRMMGWPRLWLHARSTGCKSEWGMGHLWAPKSQIENMGMRKPQVRQRSYTSAGFFRRPVEGFLGN